MAKVVVLGAGVIGLTSAIRIARGREKRGVETLVEVWSLDDVFTAGGKLTSEVAAGYWMPFHMRNDSTTALASLQTYDELCSHSDRGVKIFPGKRFFDSKPETLPFYAVKPELEFKEAVEELCENGVSFSRWYWEFKVPIVDASKYLRALMAEAETLGVKFLIGEGNLPAGITQGKLKDVVRVVKEHGNHLMVNCTGLYSRDMCEDKNVFPIRGVTVRVELPEDVKEFLFEEKEESDPTYILPRGDSKYCTLGGTYYVHDSNTEMTDEDANKVIQRCAKLKPSILSATVEGYYCASRPHRDEIRCEIETFPDYDDLIPVIHNYGHGGIGWTTCWGFATTVEEMVRKVEEGKYLQI